SGPAPRDRAAAWTENDATATAPLPRFAWRCLAGWCRDSRARRTAPAPPAAHARACRWAVAGQPPWRWRARLNFSKRFALTRQKPYLTCVRLSNRQGSKHVGNTRDPFFASMSRAAVRSAVKHRPHKHDRGFETCAAHKRKQSLGAIRRKLQLFLAKRTA